MNLDDSDELKRDKKYVKFQGELHKCLTQVERTPLSDWASLNNGLVQIQRVIDSTSYAELKVVPERMLLCRVLGKCLDPTGAMGVHKKAVETLGKVCTKLGPVGISKALPLLTVNVLHLLPTAAMQTRPDILSLVESHFLALPSESLALCLPGLLGGVISCIEEGESTDLYRRGLHIVQTMQRRMEEMSIPQVFFHALWSSVRNAPSVRISCLMYLRLVLKKAPSLPSVEEQEAAQMTQFAVASELTEASLIDGDTALVLAALQTALQDKSEKCLRLALDVVVFHFPLHLENVLTFHEKVALMTSALRLLVTNPQNSTLRRVFMWVYGGNEYNVAYYRSVSARYITQSLINLFESTTRMANAVLQHREGGHPPSLIPASAMASFEVLLSLLSRPAGEEHFLELIPDVIGSVCHALEAIYLVGDWNASNTNVQKIFRLLEVMPWRHFLMFVKECGDELLSLVACGSVEETLVLPVVNRMLRILDATRLHYVPLPSSAQCIPEVIALCETLCSAVEQMARCARCQTEHIRQALEVFHVAYLGIGKGLLMGQQQPRQPDDGETNTATSDPPALCLDAILEGVIRCFVAIASSKSGALGGAANADDIFCSSVQRPPAERQSVNLFAEAADTLLSVLSHTQQKPSDFSAAVMSRRVRDSWLVTCLDVVSSSGAGLAIVACSLVFEVYCGELYDPREWPVEERLAVCKRLLTYLWPLFTVTYAEHHVQLAKLFIKLWKRSELREMINDTMKAPHPSNCRQFLTLFRLAAESGVTDHCFDEGLLMVLSSATSTDPSMRLMCSSFVEQSLPYMNRVIEPLLQRLVQQCEDAGDDNSSTVRAAAVNGFLTVVYQLLRTTTGRDGSSVAQKLWSLQLPSSVTRQLMSLFDKQQQQEAPFSPSIGSSMRSKSPFALGADNEMIVNNTFALILFLAVRVIRLELQKYYTVGELLFGSSATPTTTTRGGEDDEAMLRQSSTPSVTQGEETTSCILALDVVLLALRCSVRFPDPPETVTNMCIHFGGAAMELLSTAVAARLPTVQVQLLELLELTVPYLDGATIKPSPYGKKRSFSDPTTTSAATNGGSGNSPGDAASSAAAADGESGVATTATMSPATQQSLLASSVNNRTASRSRRAVGGEGPGSVTPSRDSATAANVPITSPPVLAKDCFRTLRQGIVAAAVAELHPTLSCYGLLQHWKSTLSAFLPYFHDTLHIAVYEYCSCYCSVIKAVRERPLSPSTGCITQRALQGINELLLFLFRSTTKEKEGTPFVGAEGSSNNRKLESVTQLPMWLLQQGLTTVSGGGDGGASGLNTSLSNYDLSIKELSVCLELLISTCLETFLGNRKALTDESTQRHRDAVAALQSIRQQVEAPIKSVVETLLKDTEVDFFDRLLWLWTKRNATLLSQGTLLVTVDGSDDSTIADLLSMSAGVTPASVINVSDQLLQRYRRGAVKAVGNGNARPLQDMPFDVTVFHFLFVYFGKCKGADRFDRCITPLLDVMLAHTSSATSSQSSVSWLTYPLMLKLLTTLQKRYHAATQGELSSKDRRCTVMVGKMLEAFTSNSQITEADEALLLAMKCAADHFPEFVSALISKDASAAEKLSESVGALYYKLLGPTITGAMNHKGGYEKILQMAPRTHAALSLLLSIMMASTPQHQQQQLQSQQGTSNVPSPTLGVVVGASQSIEGLIVPKKLKTELIEVLFSQNFFKMSRQAVSKWRLIFERLTADRTVNVTMLQRFSNTPTTPQSMLTAIVQSQEDEASARGRYLKRLAFYVFSAASLDREFITGIREKLSDTFRQFGKQGKLVPVRYAMFVFRVLMTRVPPQLLLPFWSVIVPELIRCLSAKPSGDDDFYLAMEALKVIDFALCVLPSEFQVFRWVFLDDAHVLTALYDGSSVPLKAAGTFLPLIRAHFADAAKSTFSLSSVRKETYPRTNLASKGVQHRPLFAIPERCYLDLRGIDGVSLALSLTSNCTNDSAIEELRDKDDDGGFYCTPLLDEEAKHLIRCGDQHDAQFVDWLLEAEFLHVGVAASEQKHQLQQQQQSQRAMPAAGTGAGTSAGTGAGTSAGTGAGTSAAPFQSPTLSPRLQQDTSEFVDVSNDR